MSYILDALRKSEQQRQQGATPTLGAAPFPTPQTGPAGKSARLLPALIAIVLLGIGITIGWLRPWQHEADTNALAQAPQAAPTVPAPALPMAPPPTLVPAEKPVAPPPPPIPQPAPAKVTPTAVLLPAAPKTEAGSRPPPPNITITVHAYSPDPAERLAGINGKLLREGQEISPGLKLERITMDGVILNDHGQHLRRSVQ